VLLRNFFYKLIENLDQLNLGRQLLPQSESRRIGWDMELIRQNLSLATIFFDTEIGENKTKIRQKANFCALCSYLCSSVCDATILK